MSEPTSQEWSSEATDFFKTLRADFDVSGVLSWSYQIDGIPEDNVSNALDALEQAGFASVEVVDGDEEAGYTVVFSESRRHDTQSFAARVHEADALAKKFNGALGDYSAGL